MSAETLGKRWKKRTSHPKVITLKTALVIYLNFVFIMRELYLWSICFSLSSIKPFISGMYQGISSDSWLSRILQNSRVVCTLRQERQWREDTFHITRLKGSQLRRDTSNSLCRMNASETKAFWQWNKRSTTLTGQPTWHPNDENNDQQT